MESVHEVSHGFYVSIDKRGMFKVTNCDLRARSLNESRGKHLKYMPHAFTGNGVATKQYLAPAKC